MSDTSTPNTGSDPELLEQFGAVRVVRRRRPSALRRRVRRVLRAVGTLVCTGAAAICLAFTALTLVGHWTMPMVLTGSMSPAIDRGDVVLAEPVPVDRIRQGDVIVFIAPGDRRVTVHRVDSIVQSDTGMVVTTRGDANEAPDPWQLHMDREWVHRVRATVPHLGGILRATHSAGSLHVLLGLGSAALVVVVGLRSIWAPNVAALPVRRRRRIPTVTPTVATVVVVGVLGALAGIGASGPADSADAALLAAASSPATLGTGTLPTPTAPTCRWSSATAVTLDWTPPAAGLQTATVVERSATADGAGTTVTTVTPASVGTATVTVPSPVTTNRFHRLRTARDTWTSDPSDELRSDECSGAIRAFAGNGNAGATGDGGPAVAATLSQPRGLAVSVDGDTYVADTANHRIRVVAVDGTITTFAGGPSASACSYSGPVAGLGLNAPRDVAVDTTGSVYIADTGANCIRRVSAAGVVSPVAGGGSTTACSAAGAATSVSLSAPSGVAVDTTGTVYIADTTRNCVRRVTGGNVSSVAGGGATTGCTGSAAASAVSLSRPIDVAVDTTGAVYIADTGRACVRRVESNTATVAMGGGATTACASAVSPTAISLLAPEGVAVDPTGTVYVVDTGRRCIRAANGATTRRVALTGTSGSAGDGGPAIAATARTPSGIATTPSGDLLVSDRSATAGSNEVRRIVGP